MMNRLVSQKQRNTFTGKKIRITITTFELRGCNQNKCRQFDKQFEREIQISNFRR